MAHWLKMLGSGTESMDESLVPRVLRELRYPKRPRIGVGDKIAFYATLPDLDVRRELHRSIGRHTHIALTEAEYARAVECLRMAGADEDRLYRP